MSRPGWRAGRGRGALAGLSVVLLLSVVRLGAGLSTAQPVEVAGPAGQPSGVPRGAQPGVVDKVVDGDTIWVRIHERDSGPLAADATHKLRLLEIDTPETQHPTKGRECWGDEATAYTAERLAAGSRVWLLADKEDTDRYGRFLRYVWTDDGDFFNEQVVREGHARASLYEPNDRYIGRIRTAEAEARAQGRGMWGGRCGGTHRGEPERQVSPRSPPGTAADTGPGCHASYEGACVPITSDVDCAGGLGDGPDFVGQVTVVGPDVYDLDSDGDGDACLQD